MLAGRGLELGDGVISRAKKAKQDGCGDFAIGVIPRQQRMSTPLVEHCFDHSKVAWFECGFKETLHRDVAFPLQTKAIWVDN